MGRENRVSSTPTGELGGVDGVVLAWDGVGVTGLSQVALAAQDLVAN